MPTVKPVHVQPDLTPEEELALGADLATISAADLDDAPRGKHEFEEGEQGEQVPDVSSPEWAGYVMRQFENGELDENGRPFVTGLRRVARKVLGPILKSASRVVQAPSMVPGNEKLTLLQPAVVEHTVVFLLEDKNGTPYQAEFTEAADAHLGNTDLDFAVYPTAMASTRAEGRALRKALQLTGIAAEEKPTLPGLDAPANGLIAPHQVNFLNVLCSRNDINLVKFINAGKDKYADVYEVPFAKAQAMVEYLSGLQNSGNIPTNLRGYDKGWQRGTTRA